MATGYGDTDKSESMSPKLQGLDADELNWNDVVEYIDRKINVDLRGYYVVPFASPYPDAIINLANLLYAGWGIFIRYSENSPNDFPNNRFWNMGMDLLGRIQNGTVVLEKDKAQFDTTDQYADMQIKSDTEDLVPMFNAGDETDWRDPVVDRDGERIDGRVNEVDI